jgi:hypothetical protein
MTEQEELIQEIRERLGEMPKEALPFDLLAFANASVGVSPIWLGRAGKKINCGHPQSYVQHFRAP